jgi:hypothetical protein
MKPDLLLVSPRSFSRCDEREIKRARFPLTTAEFQPPRDFPPGGGGGFDGDRSRARFNRLANEVLRSDPSRTFWFEATALGVVTLVSFWPVAVMVREVIRLFH